MKHLPARLLGLACILVLLASTASAYTGDHPKMKVRLEWPSQAQWTVLQEVPDLDPMRVVTGEEVILVSSPDQVAQLQALGFTVEVLVPDMEEDYAAQRRDLRNFGLLFTYSEAVALLDELHTLYPAITTEKFSIGTSRLGNTIWALKVSDNPNLDEDEPEVLFDALHHAREPITVNVNIETIRYLCENYGTDPEVTFLVNNREVFFVPTVNVDGYLYNESTYPSGGGMWRKNRRDNPGTTCDGVDLNRNYPNHWGEVGTSTDPCDETYCGPSAGSEPCIQAIMNFIAAHDIVTQDSYHSVAALILFPWSWTTAHTPDDALLREIAYTLQGWCGYDVGQPGEVLYTCSGTTTDWAYAEHGVLSFCTEVDGSGFWPADSEVDGLVAENIPKNLYLMKIAGPYLTVTESLLSGGDGDQTPEAGETLNLVLTLHNEGVAQATNATLTLSSDDPYVQLVDPVGSVGVVDARGEGDNAGSPLAFSIDPACPTGHTLTLNCRVVADNFRLTYPLTWTSGALIADDMESGQGEWTHAVVTSGWTDQWHQSTQRNHTPGGDTSWKFGNTGAGDYANNCDGALLTPAFSCAGSVELKFWHWMEAEVSSYYTGQAYDGGVIEVSLNGGAWTQVTPEGGYTHIARGSGPFPLGTPLFSGVIDWRSETVRLDGYAGTLQFRFRFGTDGADVREGWYVDDVEIFDRTVTNTLPSAPALVGPLDGAIVETAYPTLTVANSTDPDPGDVLTYGFRVYTDSRLTELLLAVNDIPEGSGTTAWTVTPGLQDGTYYWRAFADDGHEWGPCMDAAQFIVEGAQGIAESTPAGGLRVFGVTPSPAPGWTALRFEVGREGWVKGEIFDLSGRCVRTLAGRCGTGMQSFVWDGRDGAGHPVPGGLYLYRIGGGEEAQTGRIVMIR